MTRHCHPERYMPGMRLQHPTDGPIEILRGQYQGVYGISNHWTWRVLATGEEKSGYAGFWPETDAVIQVN